MARRTTPRGKGPSKQPSPKLDLKTQRRILRFINDASSPPQLVDGPARVFEEHAEHRGRGHPDPHDIRDAHLPSARLLKPEQAEKLIELRDRRSPLYGFLNLDELLEIRDLRDFIDSLSAHLSAAAMGEWQGPFSIPGAMDRPIHAALLRTGDVLFFGGLPSGTVTYRYTPDPTGGLGSFTPVTSAPGDSLFCAGHVFLSDGRLLVAGGGGDGTGPRHNHAWIFDPGRLRPERGYRRRTAGDVYRGVGSLRAGLGAGWRRRHQRQPRLPADLSGAERAAGRGGLLQPDRLAQRRLLGGRELPGGATVRLL